jgi:hypothetical protein
LALAAGFTVFLLTPHGGNGSGGGKEAVPTVAAGSQSAPGPVVAAAARPQPDHVPRDVSGKLTAQAAIAKSAIAAAGPKVTPPRNNNADRPESNVVLPRDEVDKPLKNSPVLVAEHSGKSDKRRGPATVAPNGRARVLAAALPSSSGSPSGSSVKPTPSAPAPRMAQQLPRRDVAPGPTIPPAPPMSAPSGITPPEAIAAAPPTSAAPVVTASLSSGALKEEGGRLRIVQPRSAAGMPSVEAEPVERMRNVETRVASTYQELGQGQGASGLLVGSR